MGPTVDFEMLVPSGFKTDFVIEDSPNDCDNESAKVHLTGNSGKIPNKSVGSEMINGKVACEETPSDDRKHLSGDLNPGHSQVLKECKICGKSLSTNFNLRHHIRTVHSDDKLLCKRFV